MGSSLDRFLEKAKETTPQAPVPKGTDSFEQFLSGAAEPDTLDASMNLGAEKDPALAERVVKMQMKTGLPADFIERNIDAVEKATSKDNFDPVQFKKQSPELAKWLAEDPNNVAIARQDFSRLSYIERQVGNIKSQFETGQATIALSDIGWKALTGEATPEDRKRQKELETEMSSHNPLDYNITGFFEGIPGAIANQVPILERLFVDKAKGAIATGTALGTAEAVPFAGAGAVAGAITQGPGGIVPGAIRGGLSGFRQGFTQGAPIGWRYAGAVSAGRLEASLAYLDFEKLKDENGNPLDRNTMVGAAAVVGIINGALEMVELKALSKTIPGVRALERDGMKHLLETPTMRRAVRHYLAGIGENFATEGATEFMQDIVKDAGGVLAQMAQDGSLMKAGPEEILRRIFTKENLAEAIADARAGAQGGGGLAAATGATSLVFDAQKIKRAEGTQKFFEALGSATQDSELKKKVPEKLQEAVDRLTKNGPIENTYMPLGFWKEYWQSQNVDPAEAAEEVLGDRKAYDEAEATGSDLVIPTSVYATKIAGTDHNKAFVREVRLAPDALNAREADELKAQLDAEDAAAAKRDAEIQPEVNELRGDFYEQLLRAGMSEDVAREQADLFERMIKNLARKQNVSPRELLKEHGLEIKKGNEDEVRAEREFQQRGRAPENVINEVSEQIEKHQKEGEKVISDFPEENRKNPLTPEEQAEYESLLDEVDTTIVTNEMHDKWRRLQELKSKRFSFDFFTSVQNNLQNQVENLESFRDALETGRLSPVEVARMFFDLQKTGFFNKDEATSALAQYIKSQASRGKVRTADLVMDLHGAALAMQDDEGNAITEEYAPVVQGIMKLAAAVRELDLPRAIEAFYNLPEEDRDILLDIAPSVFDFISGDTKSFEQGPVAEEGQQSDEEIIAEAQRALEAYQEVVRQIMAFPDERRAMLREAFEKSASQREKTFAQSAFHGTRHKFNVFDLHKIGSGEGSQAFGWGLYFTQLKKVAEYYRNTTSQSDLSEQIRIDGAPLYEALGDLLDNSFSVHWTIEALQHALNTKKGIDEAVVWMDQKIREASRRIGPAEFDVMNDARTVLQSFVGRKLSLDQSKKGRVFKVDLPEDEDLILWDEEADRQSVKLQKIISSTPWLREIVEDTNLAAIEDAEENINELIQRGELEDMTFAEITELAKKEYEPPPFMEILKELETSIEEELDDAQGDGRKVAPWIRKAFYATRRFKAARGEDVYIDGADAPQIMSRMLGQIGIAGIKFLDRGSRTKGKGTYNFVIFDDKLVKILEFEQASKFLPGFFSKAEQIVEQKMPNRAKADQIRAILKEVKAEEWKWLGLDDYLKENADRVLTKEEVLEYIRGHNIKLSERNRLERRGELDFDFNHPLVEEEYERLLGHYIDQELRTRLLRTKVFEEGNAEGLQPGHYYYLAEMFQGLTEEEYTFWSRHNWRFSNRYEVEKRVAREGMPEGGDAEIYLDPDPGSQAQFERWKRLSRRIEENDQEALKKPHGPFSDDNELMYHLRAEIEIEAGNIGRIDEMMEEALATVIEDNADDISDFSHWTLDGGSNYREILFFHEHGDRGPNARRFYSSHFEETNDPTQRVRTNIAHVRVKDRTNPLGETVLFLEEVQSDLHQKGREEGYHGDPLPVPKEDLLMVKERLQVLRHQLANEDDINRRRQLRDEIHSAEALLEEFRDQNRNAKAERVPDAPFRSNWHEFVLKRMIREAAEKGYDHIAWTTGFQQSIRYPNLARHVRTLAYNPDTRTLNGIASDGQLLRQPGVTPGELHNYVGRNTAERLLATDRITADDLPPDRGEFDHRLADLALAMDEPSEERGSWHTLDHNSILVESDEDVRLTKGGMEAFYDGIVARFMAKFGKKYGAEVRDMRVLTDDGEYKNADFQVVPAAIYEPGDQEGPLFNVIDPEDDIVASGLTEEQAQRAAEQYRREYLETMTAVVHSMKLTPALKKAAMEQGFPLFQKEEEAEVPRGRIRFGDAKAVIELFQKADPSTVMHESAHFYLETLSQLVESGKATDEVKKDFETIRKWVGAEGDAPFTREQHEMFSRGFEAYLMDGKAPVQELQSVFSKFKLWLSRVYSSVKALNVQLTPDIRDVFDRMLASEEELDNAYTESGLVPLITDPASLGMSEKQAEDYNNTLLATRQAAENSLTARIMADHKREQDNVLRAERAQARAEVIEELNQDKVALVTAMLQHGRMPDGSPLPEGVEPIKINRRALVDHYGGDENVLKAFQRPYIYTREGGLHPEEVAQLYGFSSADEMLRALPGPGDEKLDQKIERLTNEKMKQNSSDILLNPQELKDEALKAVHNEKRATLLRKELEILASNDLATLKGLVRKISRRVPTNEAIREEAQRIIGEKLTRDLRPDSYRRAEGKMAKQAVEALLKGDIEAAFDFKLKELLNHELYRAALDAKTKTQKDVKYVRNLAKPKWRQRLGRAGGDYLQQLDALRKRFGFAAIPDEELENRRPLSEFIREQTQDLGFAVSIDPRIQDEVFSRNYDELSVNDFNEVMNAVRQIIHLARNQNKLLSEEYKISMNEAAERMISSMAEHHEFKDEPPDYAPGLLKRLRTSMKNVVAYHTKLEFLFEWLDGNKANGPVWQLLFKPFADAEDAENEMMSQSVTALNDIFHRYSRLERSLWFYKRIYIPEMKTSFTKSNLIAIALNMGNDYNRDALLEGWKNFGWDETHLEKLLGHLDKRDWETVQAIWDHLDTYWPLIAKLETELNGLPPKRVQSREFTNVHGTWRGGYYPIAFDGNLSWRQHILDSMRSTKELFGGNWASAMTRHGHTEARKGTGGKPLLLDLSVLTTHISNVVHDLTHRRAVIDVNRLVRREDVRGAIEGVAGRKMYRQIHPWLANIAADRRGDHTNPIEAMLSRARSGATVVSMGWKFTTAVAQFLSYTNTVAEIGPKYSALGLADVYAQPWRFRRTYNFITERSRFMHDRLTNYDRDVREALKGLNVSGTNTGPLSILNSMSRPMRNSFFYLIGLMDMAVSLPSWMGAYKKAMEGGIENIEKGNEEAAIHYADRTIRLTQGVGSAKDLATVQRGPEAARVFTMFYTYFAGLFNQFAKATRQVSIDKNVPKFIAQLTLLWFIPAVLGEMVVGRAPDPDDDPDEWKKWLIKTEFAYPFQTVVLLRDVINGMDKFGYSPSAAFDAFESFSNAGKAGIKAADPEQELNETDYKNLTMAAGYIGHLPSRQVWLTGSYFYDWWTGNTEPSGPFDAFYRATVTGTPKEDR